MRRGNDDEVKNIIQGIIYTVNEKERETLIGMTVGPSPRPQHTHKKRERNEICLKTNTVTSIATA